MFRRCPNRKGCCKNAECINVGYLHALQRASNTVHEKAWAFVLLQKCNNKVLSKQLNYANTKTIPIGIIGILFACGPAKGEPGVNFGFTSQRMVEMIFMTGIISKTPKGVLWTVASGDKHLMIIQNSTKVWKRI